MDGPEADGATAAATPETRETGDGSKTLYSHRYRQTFHSHHGALTESRHVFLEGSGAGRRLRAGEPLRILEVGLGTGLNFFLTAAAAREGGGTLEYTALERDLLPAAVLERLGHGALAPAIVDDFLSFRRSLPDEVTPGSYRFPLAGCLPASCGLTLVVGEADAVELKPASFDVIYHDAFSPDVNVELWSQPFLARLAAALAPAGTLASYTVKGEVRRALQQVGLTVEKFPGPPGGKREALRAVKPA